MLPFHLWVEALAGTITDTSVISPTPPPEDLSDEIYIDDEYDDSYFEID